MFEKFIENYKKKKTAQKVKAEHEDFKRQERLKAEAKERAFQSMVSVYSCYPPKMVNGKYMATDKNFFKLVYDAILKGGTDVNLNFIDTTYVTDMSFLFSTKAEEKAIKLKLYGTEEDRSNRFFRIDIPAYKFTGDISSWNTSNVLNFSGMFYESKFNGDISKWDTSKAINMNSMFRESTFKGNISNWDTHKVESMEAMFYGAQFEGNISNWDVSNVENFDYMFKNCGDFYGDLSAWDTSSATSMMGMFEGTNWLPGIGGWNVSKVKNFEAMFKDSGFNEDISNWDVSSAVNMNEMFRSSKFDKDISNWNTCNLEVANDIFYNSVFSGSIINWNTFKVIDLPAMIRRHY